MIYSFYFYLDIDDVYYPFYCRNGGNFNFDFHFFFFENIPSFFELLNTHPGVPNFVGGYNSVSTESNFILLESLLHIEKSINYVDI